MFHSIPLNSLIERGKKRGEIGRGTWPNSLPPRYKPLPSQGDTVTEVRCFCTSPAAFGQLRKTDIKEMGDRIGDNRRAGAALWKPVLKAGNLRDERCHLAVQFETVVAEKESSDASEVERREEILEIQSEDVPASFMLASVRDDGKIPAKPV